LLTPETPGYLVVQSDHSVPSHCDDCFHSGVRIRESGVAGVQEFELQGVKACG
jgi:hypothetical protein